MLRQGTQWRFIQVAYLAAGLAALAGCVAPATRLAAVSPERLAEEKLFQQKYVISGTLADQERVDRVAYPIMKAAVGLCESGLVPMAGFRLATAHDFGARYVAAARSLGFSDTLIVTSVVPGAPAERGGLHPGDRLVEVNAHQAPVGRQASRDIVRLTVAPSKAPKSRRRKGEPPPTLTAEDSILTLEVRAGVNPISALPPLLPVAHELAGDEATTLTVASNPVTGQGEQRNVIVQPEWVCGGNAIAIKSNELNAWTDGRNISITSSMLRFATSDEELALVIGHEIAHNIMGHIQAQRKNAVMGSIFGALFDIVAATQGVNTNGDFTRAGGEIGAMQFSQEFELEADYVGLYLMARAGIPMDGALEFWRRMAAEDPDMIQFASSHPTAPRRFVGLESALQEIEGKRRAGEPLVPTLEKDTVRSEEKR